jgi:hypothetical protein
MESISDILEEYTDSIFKVPVLPWSKFLCKSILSWRWSYYVPFPMLQNIHPQNKTPKN